MSRRAGLALAVAGLIGAVTASWWALALWPMPAAAPVWLVRARDVCFGTAVDGLPNAGGWLLLVGEPVGMIGLLWVIWGEALREGMSALVSRWWGIVTLALVGAAGLGVVGWVGYRIRTMQGTPFQVNAGANPVALEGRAPDLMLVNQRGDLVRRAGESGRPALVAFAYGHCETVCPLVVRDVLEGAIRLGSRAPDLVFVTLDPWRDTPARLPTIAAAWDLPAGAQVLSGPAEAVEQALDRWGIRRTRDTVTGAILHQRTVILVSGSGRLAFRLDGAPDGVVAAVDALRRSGSAD